MKVRGESLAKDIKTERNVCVPRLMGETDAAWYLGISASMLRTYKLPRRMVKSRRLYERSDLDAFADSLEFENEEDRACAEADAVFGCAG